MNENGIKEIKPREIPEEEKLKFQYLKGNYNGCLENNDKEEKIQNVGTGFKGHGKMLIF